ncbi:MAG: DNA-processing protein DprA, partial [Lachnospiraceae bacterium]|nr:DNA-processing protein DprA [Lachnospiraceae bacterium]
RICGSNWSRTLEKSEGLNAEEYEMACRNFLMHVDGIGAATAVKIVEHYGGARRIWELEEKDVRQEQRMNERQKNNFIDCRRRWNLVGEWQKLKNKGIKTVSFDGRIYPRRLREIPNKPFLLYYIGGLPAETMPCVAVIGARMCSEYGRFIAAELAAGLAKRGIQVVSGMADGIDGIAQRSALEHGGMSYGVLGCGVDVCYPSSNRALYQTLQIQGGVLSEFPPGTKPESRHFPMRNRIISGLADLILVIEAKERSGTQITVNMALEQGKEVYAVPGRITDELSRGCNRMILEGAGVATDINELAEAAWQAWERTCRQVQEGEMRVIAGERGKEKNGVGKKEIKEEKKQRKKAEERGNIEERENIDCLL